MDTQTLKSLHEGTCKAISKIFVFKFGEYKKLLKNPIATLISTLPYLAKTKDAERQSIKNIAVYLTALKVGSTFNYIKDEGIDGRINHILPTNGDTKVIEKGKKLLMLVSLNDHLKDVDVDKTKNKYNPVAAKEVDYVSLKDTLVKTLSKDKVEQDSFDSILPLETAEKFSWWNL
jgi:hypothetical protein